MEIDYYKNPFASKRMNVIARNGVVCTGSNLATQAGLRMLLQGGNAVDAASPIKLELKATIKR